MKNNEVIKAKNTTIYDFLKETKNIVIPRYQRPYSWEKNNVNTLINDFKSDYYIGNIIEYCIKDNKEIIDGQQRLITIFLVLIAIYNKTEDDSIKEEINQIIKTDNKCKMILKSRIANDGRDILELLIESEKKFNFKEFAKKYNEIKIYQIIQKELEGRDINELYRNIMNSNIVEISFSKNQYSAHEMFVNVNTKGKPLENIEILKSQLFKFLLDNKNSDIYKEEWEKMLNSIPAKEYKNLCNDVYLIDYFLNNNENKYSTNGTVDENSIKLINSITDQARAEKIFNFMTGSNLDDLYEVYRSIKSYDLESLKEKYYNKDKIKVLSFQEINEIWNLYGEFRFKQSDILFIAIFYKNEELIFNHIGFINLVLKYLLMYEIYRSFAEKSPAKYENIFKQAAATIINSKTINDKKETVKSFIKKLEIKEDEYENFKEKIGKNAIFNSSRYKLGKYIILMAEESYTKNLITEHFVSQKTKNEEDEKLIGYLGNLIPVVKDRYKDKTACEKLNLYREDKEFCDGIKKFLKYGFNENNYKEKIKERSENIAKEFITKMQNYYKEITNEK